MQTSNGEPCHWVPGPGTYAVVIAAPGYSSEERTVTVGESDSDDCCDCGWVTARVEVALAAP